jgi:anaerobic ribonucleoside-triphosphate reductase
MPAGTAVCEACGWEGPETLAVDASGARCPKCGRDDVCFFWPSGDMRTERTDK